MSGSVNYGGYKASAQPRSRGVLLDVLRSGYSFVRRRLVYDTLLYPYAAWQHHRLLRTTDRTQGHTYTGFHRSPAQLEAICGPVMDHLLGTPRAQRNLEILVFAGSNGAEAYTLASLLLPALPEISIRITSSDLHTEMVQRGRAAHYSRDEILHHPHITRKFVRRTFDRNGRDFVVKPAIRAMVSFDQANLLDSRSVRNFAPADLVLAQNVLFHLQPHDAERAFDNLLALLKPRSALCINGMDLDLRSRLTREAGLEPLDYNTRLIHEQSRMHISSAWWRYYYGIEPYCSWRPNHLNRYATIFVKGRTRLGIFFGIISTRTFAPENHLDGLDQYAEIEQQIAVLDVIQVVLELFGRILY